MGLLYDPSGADIVFPPPLAMRLDRALPPAVEYGRCGTAYECVYVFLRRGRHSRDFPVSNWYGCLYSLDFSLGGVLLWAMNMNTSDIGAGLCGMTQRYMFPLDE